MKVAAVIGDVFDVQMLNACHPFKDFLKPDRMRELVSELQKQELLEIVD
jgi:hypothetical protein